MKRNWEIIRGILLDIESGDFDNNTDLLSDDVIVEHVRLLSSGKFIEAAIGSGVIVPGTSLTWAGCEMLDLLRDEDVWYLLQPKLRTESYPWEILKIYAGELNLNLLRTGTFQGGAPDERDIEDVSFSNNLDLSGLTETLPDSSDSPESEGITILTDDTEPTDEVVLPDPEPGTILHQDEEGPGEEVVGPDEPGNSILD